MRPRMICFSHKSPAVNTFHLSLLTVPSPCQSQTFTPKQDADPHKLTFSERQRLFESDLNITELDDPSAAPSKQYVDPRKLTFSERQWLFECDLIIADVDDPHAATSPSRKEPNKNSRGSSLSVGMHSSSPTAVVLHKRNATTQKVHAITCIHWTVKEAVNAF